MKKQYIILVPGLEDNALSADLVTKHWKKYGVFPIVHNASWKNTKESFKTKLDRLLKRIDELSKDSDVSLIGMSAGASLVMNAYIQRKGKIKSIINVCGRLRESGFPSLDIAVDGISSFKESVLECERNLKKLITEDKKKILTFSAIFDGIVPLSAVPISGAENIKVPFFFHTFAIAGVLIFYKKQIVNFILQ